ncbi:MAG: sigma factor-like helix-turn-helix DNA-binding protein [Aristaeellaceae bacterium]
MREERMADEVSRKVEIAWLMAFYGGMLTDKQREVLALHCEEDMSLAEIAQETGVSRQGVHDMLTRSAQRLLDMEDKLGVAARFRRMETGLERCRALLREKRYDEAEGVLDALIRLDQEESNGL